MTDKYLKTKLAYLAKIKKNNPEKYKAWMKKGHATYYEKNKESILKKMKEKRDALKEERQKKALETGQPIKDKVKSEYYYKNREKILKKMKEKRDFKKQCEKNREHMIKSRNECLKNQILDLEFQKMIKNI